MSEQWMTKPDEEEAFNYLVGLLKTARAAGIGIALFPEQDGGWTVEAVGSAISDSGYHDFDIPGTRLAEADALHHAVAAAKRKLGRLTDELATAPH